MNEKKLSIKQNGQFKNIDFKELGVDEYVVLEKDQYNEGLEKEGKYGAYFIVTALYNGDSVSFFMNENVHNEWKNTGGLGDKIALYKTEEKVKLKSGTLLVERLHCKLHDGEAQEQEETESDDLLA